MGRKSSQLQIRISSDQKLELKARAGAAGLSVSRYVLERALPRGPAAVDADAARAGTMVPAEALIADPTGPGWLQDLARDLVSLSGPELARAAEGIDVRGLSDVLSNQLAGLVEMLSRSVGQEPPEWVVRVAPLDRPYFARTSARRQPAQLRSTPAPFGRRNVFLDAEDTPVIESGRRIVRPSGPFASGGGALARADEAFASAGLRADLCPLAGKIVAIAFSADAPGGDVAALLPPPWQLREAIGAVTPGYPDRADWLADLIDAFARVGATGREPYVELTSLRCYAARPEYLLAASCAALVHARDRPTERAIALLLASLEERDPARALEIVERYVPLNQLPPNLESVLGDLVGGSAQPPLSPSGAES